MQQVEATDDAFSTGVGKCPVLGILEHHFQVFVGAFPNRLGDVQLGHLPTPVLGWLMTNKIEETLAGIPSKKKRFAQN